MNEKNASKHFGLSGPGVALALVSAVGFSTLGIFATQLYGFGFSVPQTLAWRFTVASVFLWCFIGIRKRMRSRGRPLDGMGSLERQPGGMSPVSATAFASGKAKATRDLLLLALFGFTPQAGLYFLTVKLLAPGITSLLLYLYPAFVLLVSAFFLHRKPSAGQLVALVMSFLGCVVTFFEPGAYPLAGLLLGVLVAISYGAYLVCGEKILADFDPFFSTAVIMTTAGIFYWGLLLIGGFPVKVPGSFVEWFFIACLALIATVLPITTLFSAMKRIGAANASLISTVEPVVTVLFSALMLGEELTANRIWGGLFILGGVVTLRLFSLKRA
ncbi:MAG TPA: DMT family transporter [Rectinemataceae bacterium]|nr:DMT family transporter [Rectinemataceae bacterium]